MKRAEGIKFVGIAVGRDGADALLYALGSNGIVYKLCPKWYYKGDTYFGHLVERRFYTEPFWQEVERVFVEPPVSETLLQKGGGLRR